ncbi:MAG: EAL domain-containing protein [Actinomycetia bacterium]|nr:EAL domain-containing protein [Actinomycetes bacterium]
MSDNAAHRGLRQVITSAATQLMAANAATFAEVSRQVMAKLSSHLGVDRSFLRYNDHTIHASRLIAEWPARPGTPDPDPHRLVYFADADRVLAESEHGKRPMVFRPDGATPASSSIAVAPLVSGEVTTGVLGFVLTAASEWIADELSTLEAMAALFALVQARIEAEEQLRYLAEHDEMTGLPNRRILVDHLDARLKNGEPGPVSALLVDLDRLQAINDYVGHTAGDGFIRVLAERLRDSAEGAALAARLDGDEFVLVPTGPMDAAAAETLARRLRSTLCEGVTIDGEVLTRTVSIAVALGVPGKDSTSEVFRRADHAMNAAKNSGGNTVSVYTDDMAIQNAFRNDIELNLRSVIENGALHLNYLPEVDMRTGDIVAAEALVRWQHPTHGLLSPDLFVGIAESINLAGELGRWVLRTACAELAGWRCRGVGNDVLLRVNISPMQLVTDGFVESVADVMTEFGLERGSVCLEVTERAVVQDLATTRNALAGLKDAGVQVAIDDFGTGYSALSHLKTLRVDTLKIDQSFIRELGSDPGDLAIVRAIIALAEAFDLDVVAEGVETAAAALTLLRQGCHRAQGFLLSRPVAAAAAEALLAKGRIPLSF